MASAFDRAFTSSFQQAMQNIAQDKRDKMMEDREFEREGRAAQREIDREARLNERMKGEREAALGESLLKELGETGADVSSFRRDDGGIYGEAAEMELNEARKQAIAGTAAGYTGGGIGVLKPSDSAGLSEGAFYKALEASKRDWAVEGAKQDKIDQRSLNFQARLDAQRKSEAERLAKEEWEKTGRYLASANAPEGAPLDFSLEMEQVQADIKKAEAIKAFNLKGAQTAGFRKLDYAYTPTGRDSKGKLYESVLSDVTPENVSALAALEDSYKSKMKNEESQRGANASLQIKVFVEQLNKLNTYAYKVPQKILDEHNKLTPGTPDYFSSLNKIASKIMVTRTENPDKGDRLNRPYIDIASWIEDPGSLVLDPPPLTLIPTPAARQETRPTDSVANQTGEAVFLSDLSPEIQERIISLEKKRALILEDVAYLESVNKSQEERYEKLRASYGTVFPISHEKNRQAQIDRYLEKDRENTRKLKEVMREQAKMPVIKPYPYGLRPPSTSPSRSGID